MTLDVKIGVRLSLLSYSGGCPSFVLIKRFRFRIYLLKVPVLCLDIVIVETYVSWCACIVLLIFCVLFRLRFFISSILLRL